LFKHSIPSDDLDAWCTWLLTLRKHHVSLDLLLFTPSAPPQTQTDGGYAEKFQSRVNPNIKFNHGTTTLGFIFKEGVLLAVDSRASMGSYIGSGTVQKVIPISRYLLGMLEGVY